MQLHLLSFEGPDPYARAGGIASRIDGLTRALAGQGHEVHLWFVGDPGLPGHERVGEQLHWHRWGQWISAHHPGGVYDGEDGKERDYADSLPAFLVDHHLRPALERGERAAVLAEEWHTARALQRIDALLRSAALRPRAALFWNANNGFGFERVTWPALARAATVTTVSRYMRQRMWPLEVDPLVIPNGLGDEAFTLPFAGHVQELRTRLRGRVALVKIARWDPDKRWLAAVDIAAELRRRGARPLLVARGGVEAHGAEVIARARAHGLRVGERALERPGAAGLLEATRELDAVDLLLLSTHVDPAARRLLLRSADAVLANSGHEPFGLVGLETMAAGGLACVGATGEDYALPGRNALALQSDDPREFVSQFAHVRSDPLIDARLRRAGRRTAREHAWSDITRLNLLPRLADPDLPWRALPPYSQPAPAPERSREPRGPAAPPREAAPVAALPA